MIYVVSKLTFLLQSRWTKVKGLYVVARYVPFLLFAVHLYRALTFSTHHSANELTRSCFSGPDSQRKL
jgi:hypothetical protein